MGWKYRGSQRFEEIYMAVILKGLSSKCHEILTSYMVCFSQKDVRPTFCGEIMAAEFLSQHKP